ncbi:hypothetical protein JZ078_27270, partial [Klebsiella pneumoniae]|uniref:hypothetical protein n=1 Tax=Enterobacteriaceae TaxID=543 RepID=UPI0019D4AC65
MGSCAAPSAKGDDKFITTDYLQQCPQYCSNQSESPDLMQFMQIKCSRRRLADYQQDICMATLALCIPIDAAS